MSEDAYTTYVRRRRRHLKRQQHLDGLKAHWPMYVIAALITVIKLMWPSI